MSQLPLLLAAVLLLPAGLALPAADCPGVHDAAGLPSHALRLEQLGSAGALRVLDPQLVGPPSLPDVPGASRCTELIRPGAALILGHALLCTADGLFRDARGALCIGTAVDPAFHGHVDPTLCHSGGPATPRRAASPRPTRAACSPARSTRPWGASRRCSTGGACPTTPTPTRPPAPATWRCTTPATPRPSPRCPSRPATAAARP